MVRQVELFQPLSPLHIFYDTSYGSHADQLHSGGGLWTFGTQNTQLTFSRSPWLLICWGFILFKTPQISQCGASDTIIQSQMLMYKVMDSHNPRAPRAPSGVMSDRRRYLRGIADPLAGVGMSNGSAARL